MGLYSNKYVPTIVREVAYKTNDVGFVFRTLDYEGEIRFANNKFDFIIGDSVVASIDSAGIDPGDSSELPEQTGNSGKYLYTNGVTASWQSLPSQFPSQTGNTGKFITTNGTAVSWADVPSDLPSQATHSGKYLTTDGTDASWEEIVVPTLTEKRKGIVNLTSGLNSIVFTSDIGTINYVLLSRCFTVEGDYIVYLIENKATTGFDITVGEACTLEYLAEEI
jgi:hypothetical protein